jgi:hypothetical protein
MNGMHNVMTKSRKNVIRDIALKSIHNDIVKANKNSTLTTKQMRVVLRREFASMCSHSRNDAWKFNANEYDTIRARFDTSYRAKIERASKTKSRKNAKSIDETQTPIVVA